jgi:hypothetical protein
MAPVKKGPIPSRWLNKVQFFRRVFHPVTPVKVVRAARGSTFPGLRFPLVAGSSALHPVTWRDRRNAGAIPRTIRNDSGPCGTRLTDI